MIEWKRASTSNTASLPSFSVTPQTNKSDKEDKKEDWYEQLQQVSKVPQYDMLLIIEDTNAQVGAEKSNTERAMGKHSCGVMNNNGEPQHKPTSTQLPES